MCMDRKKILEKIQWRPSGTTSQYIIKRLVTLAQKSSIKKRKSQATQSSPWVWEVCVGWGKEEVTTFLQMCLHSWLPVVGKQGGANSVHLVPPNKSATQKADRPQKHASLSCS